MSFIEMLWMTALHMKLVHRLSPNCRQLLKMKQVHRSHGVLMNFLDTDLYERS